MEHLREKTLIQLAEVIIQQQRHIAVKDEFIKTAKIALFLVAGMIVIESLFLGYLLLSGNCGG